jgi:S-adenosylmethionine hydrolase
MDLPKSVITLTTDFGDRDYFTGAMKGVMLGINTGVHIIDISHDVASHDIWGAAYLIGAAYSYFPQHSVHVVVVDPGVGSQRRPILAVTDKHYFIAPDNGVLSFVYKDPAFSRVIHIDAEHYFLPLKGSTFHARDIFAPSAAWLSKGVEADKFGEVITDFARFNIPEPVKDSADSMSGEVVYIDKFGNSISNITYDELYDTMGEERVATCKVQIKETLITGISPFYASVNKGEAGVVVNGNGFLEVFVNQGDARKQLGLKRGEKVKVILS